MNQRDFMTMPPLHGRELCRAGGPKGCGQPQGLSISGELEA